MIRQKERHQRVEIPVEGLLDIEAMMTRFLGDETVIQQLYREWAAGHRDFVNVVEATVSEPMLYRLPNHKGRLSRHWPSRVLKDFPARDHARMCAIEYAQCSRVVLPMAHYIRHSYGIMEREYFRLVVPLSGGRLAYATRALSDPRRPVPPAHA
jgi:hypothetical protein